MELFADWMLYRRELLDLTFDTLATMTGLTRDVLLVYELGLERNISTMAIIYDALCDIELNVNQTCDLQNNGYRMNLD